MQEVRAVLALLLMALVSATSASLPDIVRIGGLFNPEDELQEVAFRYAVDRINMDRVLLPKTTLVPIIERVASLDICNMTHEGVAAIFGPQSRNTAGMVQAVCDNKEIPHLETRWEPNPPPSGSCHINLYPDPQILAMAYKSLVRDMGWKSFTLIYQHDDALIRLQEVIKGHGPNDLPITIRQLDEGNDHRPLLKQIQASGESHIILDCDTDRIADILRQAREDMHTVDLDEFKNSGANITSMRIVDPTSQEVNNAVHDWTYGEMRYGRVLQLTAHQVKTEVALIHDAVFLFARALHDLASSQRITIRPLNCNSRDTWDHGYNLVNYMRVLRVLTHTKQMETRGLTGAVRFDSASGLRTDFILDVVDLKRHGPVRTATWDPSIGINRTVSYNEVFDQIIENLQQKTMVVSSRIGPPYLMETKDWEKKTGNDRYEGYSMDLIEEVSKIIGFKYIFELAPDGRYGSYDPKTKKWDGLVKQILDRPPNLFSFLSPLSVDVWIYMATAYLGVSLILFILARLSPTEWQNPHPCNQEPEELESQFNLLNSMWFAIGSLMQQGCDFLPKLTPYEWISTHPCKTEPEELENNLTLCNLIWHNCGSIMQQGSDIAPKAVSTRMVAGMWWFFTLIMISSYTANLAAFLTVERMDATIESADDLAKQTKIKYGANSNFSTYQRMWSFMESTRPSVFPASNAEGVERVLKGKRSYAFIMESTSIEYQIERNCDLMQVGAAGPELGLANVGGVFVVLIAGLGGACVVGCLEFLWNTRKVAVEERASFCSTMSEEIRFALNCNAVTKPVRKSKSSQSPSDSIGRSYDKLQRDSE
ncbi:hypothetical protein B566_EDAN002626 [Ephemera danica]|nr:hypothetical protein B566_EDAN002626 [Ephemera danica]